MPPPLYPTPCHPAGRGLIYQKWPGWLTRDCYCCTPATENEPEKLICLMNYYFEQTIFGKGLNEEGSKWEICLFVENQRKLFFVIIIIIISVIITTTTNTIITIIIIITIRDLVKIS